MKIDRSLYLVLTGALAATACASAPPAKPPYTSSDADPAFPAMKSSTAAAVPAPTTPPTPPPGEGLSGPPTPPPPPAPPKRDPKTIANNSEDDDACGHTKKRNNPVKTGSDAAGAPINCKAAAFGYSAKEGCNGPEDLVSLCEGYKRVLKPRLAAQAFACMARTPAAQKCTA